MLPVLVCGRTVFSRDEKKQDDMRHELQVRDPENAKIVSIVFRKIKILPFGSR